MRPWGNRRNEEDRYALACRTEYRSKSWVRDSWASRSCHRKASDYALILMLASIRSLGAGMSSVLAAAAALVFPNCSSNSDQVSR